MFEPVFELVGLDFGHWQGGLAAWNGGGGRLYLNAKRCLVDIEKTSENPALTDKLKYLQPSWCRCVIQGLKDTVSC